MEAFSSSLQREDRLQREDLLLREVRLLCPVCLDVLTEPVSTPCGHNFCSTCLTACWDAPLPCLCPVCRECFPSRPQLRVNTLLSELTARHRAWLQVQPGSPGPPGENRGDERSGPGSRHSQRTADTERESHHTHTTEEGGPPRENDSEKGAAAGAKVFGDLIGCVERRRAEFLSQIEEQHGAVRGRAADPIRNLVDLRARGKELEDPQRLLQDAWLLSTASGYENRAHACEETLRRALVQVQESLQDELSKLDQIRLKRVRQYAVGVTLDPDTAHPYLRLSADGRQLSCADAARDVPDNPGRFDRCPCVLGAQGLSSGRLFFAVHVGGKTNWDVGVAGERAGRKGAITACPGNGFWSVCLRNGAQYMACDARWVRMAPRAGPRDVGVFVDYEQGAVEFYDLGAGSLMYSFAGQQFDQRLHPYFSPCLTDGGRNDAPLIIAAADEL